MIALVKAKDSVLTSVAAEVVSDAEWDLVDRLAPRMVATLRAKPNGMALAAPQVGHGIRLVVAERPFQPPLAIVNPRIVELRGDVQSSVEGCLSLPGRWYVVPRQTRVVVEGVDAYTQESVRVAADEHLQARMWQHELDHLEGLLLAGRFPEAKRPAASEVPE